MEQRAVSTGIMSAAAPIGVALGFLIGPSIVPVDAADKARTPPKVHLEVTKFRIFASISFSGVKLALLDS